MASYRLPKGFLKVFLRFSRFPKVSQLSISFFKVPPFGRGFSNGTPDGTAGAQSTAAPGPQRRATELRAERRRSPAGRGIPVSHLLKTDSGRGRLRDNPLAINSCGYPPS